MINCVKILTSHIEVDHIPDHENGTEDVAEKEQKNDCQKRVDMVLIRSFKAMHVAVVSVEIDRM